MKLRLSLSLKLEFSFSQISSIYDQGNLKLVTNKTSADLSLSQMIPSFFASPILVSISSNELHSLVLTCICKFKLNGYLSDMDRMKWKQKKRQKIKIRFWFNFLLFSCRNKYPRAISSQGLVMKYMRESTWKSRGVPSHLRRSLGTIRRMSSRVWA